MTVHRAVSPSPLHASGMLLAKTIPRGVLYKSGTNAAYGRGPTGLRSNPVQAFVPMYSIDEMVPRAVLTVG